MRLSEKTISRGESPVYYYTVGHSSSPCIVFCHGASLHSGMFHHQASFFADAGYFVLCWDMRGHGRSQPLGDVFSFEDAADDLIAILDNEGVPAAVLVGHSGGGYVAQLAESKHPSRVKALAAIGSTDLSVRPSFGLGLAYRVMPVFCRFLPYGWLTKAFARQMGVKKETQDFALRASQKVDKDSFVNIFKGASRVLLEGHRRVSPRPDRPLLITHGDSDNTNRGIVKAGAPRWALKSENYRLVVIPEAGHNANQDNPLAFNKALLDWLRELGI